MVIRKITVGNLDQSRIQIGHGTAGKAGITGKRTAVDGNRPQAKNRAAVSRRVIGKLGIGHGDGTAGVIGAECAAVSSGSGPVTGKLRFINGDRTLRREDGTAARFSCVAGKSGSAYGNRRRIGVDRAAEPARLIGIKDRIGHGDRSRRAEDGTAAVGFGTGRDTARTIIRKRAAVNGNGRVSVAADRAAVTDLCGCFVAGKGRITDRG